MSNIYSLCHGTPSIAVLGQQGQVLRGLAYHRTEEGAELDERITRNDFNAQGHLKTQVDPRLFTQNNGTVNFQRQYSLSGRTLSSNSLDKGLSKAFYDAEGRVLWQIDAKETEQSFAYDELGRPISRTETGKDQHSRIAERWVYGEKEGAPEEKNLRGRVVRFYDTAGLVDYSELGFALIGQPLQQKRQLLPITMESDWQGEKEAQWQSALEETVFSTLWQYTASGQLAKQTDAQGHIQRSHFDIVGRLAQSWVKVKDGAEQEVLRAVSYNASGQKLTEVSGNGVETRFSYEPKTLRLSTVNSTRSNGECIQSLCYSYDPVGNITGIQDTNVATRYYKNQKTDGNKTFVYDSLYQLISGGGRENSDGGGNHDDAALQSVDSDSYIAYTRSYGYDRSGNLTQVKHNGATQFTRNIAVSERSNHALIDKDNNLTTDGIEGQFDAAGSQLSLDNGNSLSWNTTGQLSSVTMIARANEPDDAEYYQYSGKGMRVRKKHSRQASGTVNTQEVIYLPGLELRFSKNGDVISEALEALTLSASGQHQARLLNWTEGKPTDIDNHQVRFSLNDQLGSSVTELDYNGNILTKEEYYPFGGTSVRASKSETEVKYKTVRYSGKERDSSGLYYYGFRYYQPWAGRWLSADPAGTIDGLNLYRMVKNNPTTSRDPNGLFSIASTLGHKGVKKADKYIDKKITHYLEKKGYKTSTIIKVNKVRRTIFMGLGLGSLIGGIASGFGAGLGVAVGVGAIGFAIGGSVGWFANKLSNKFARAMAERVQGKSETVQMAAGGPVAAASATLHNASARGTVIATGSGVVSGYVGAKLDDAKRGMGGANAAGAAVGYVDNKTPGGKARIPVEVGAAAGGVVSGLMVGTDYDTAAIGEWAGSGAMKGGDYGRQIDKAIAKSGISVSIDVSSYCLNLPELPIPEKLKDGAKNFAANYWLKEGGAFEWAGAVTGGIAAGSYKAADEYTEGEVTRIKESVQESASKVTWENLANAFRNYFGSGMEASEA